MDPNHLSLWSGLLLGLASSLHCAGMCGGIASSLTLALVPDARPMQRLHLLLAAQGGRIAAYVTAGAILGVAGAGLLTAFDHPAAYQLLRWAAGLVLAWIGLSLTGLAPPLSIFDRLAAPVLARLAPWGRGRVRFGGLIGAGVLWGFLPCGMVYGTLFYAMLTGTALDGALVMLGFGLGTLPSVTLTALGITGLRRFGNRPRNRMLAGCALIAVAGLSVALPAKTLAMLCGL